MSRTRLGSLSGGSRAVSPTGRRPSAAFRISPTSPIVRGASPPTGGASPGGPPSPSGPLAVIEEDAEAVDGDGASESMAEGDAAISTVPSVTDVDFRAPVARAGGDSSIAASLGVRNRRAAAAAAAAAEAALHDEATRLDSVNHAAMTVTMQPLLARGASLLDLHAATGRGPIRHAESFRLRPAPHAAGGDGGVLGVEDFVAKYAEGDDVLPSRPTSAAGLRDATAPRGSPLSADGDTFSSLRIAPADSPTGGRPAALSTAGAGAEDLIAGTAAACTGDLPDKLSKLDLYYRPMRDADKLPLRLNSPAAAAYTTGGCGGGVTPRRAAAGGAGGDSLDTFMRTGSASGTTRSVSALAAVPRSPMRPSPAAAVPVTADGDTPLALRHRLGGRAGKVARHMSSLMRSELSTTGVHLSPMYGDEALFSFTAAAGEAAGGGGGGGGAIGVGGGAGGNAGTPSPPGDGDDAMYSTFRSELPYGVTASPASSGRFVVHPGAESRVFAAASPAAPPALPAVTINPDVRNIAAYLTTHTVEHTTVHHTPKQHKHLQDGGLGSLLTGLVEASRTKGTTLGTMSPTGAPLARDVQYDAIVKQATKLQKDKERLEANARLHRAYAGGGAV